MMGPFSWCNADRFERNESDGMGFYGYDDGEGSTTWYSESGDLDCITPTPDDEW